MKAKVNEQEMTEMVRDFIGGTTAPEKPKTEPQPSETQKQASGVIQQEMAMSHEPMPEQTDETPQVVRRISGKQRRASLEEYKEPSFPFRPSRTASPCSSAAARAMPLTASSACSAGGR